MSTVVGGLLGDRYRLVVRLATGGMGVVWQAVDERLDREVAVKLIRPEYADDPTFRQRLRIEAKAIAAIRSPYVVRIHDVCEGPDPQGGWLSYLVMELVDGQPLSAVLRAGRRTPVEVASVVQQAASALSAAHALRIIHRDIKPANLMVDVTGAVTVLDFGIARAADAVALTATAMVLGTARYLSPEQAEGGTATTASDVYSLGVVAYQCLTGRVPFDADSDVAVALAHLHDPVPALSDGVPDDLAALVIRMLAKAPEDRSVAQQVATTAAEIGQRLSGAPAVGAAPLPPLPLPTRLMPTASTSDDATTDIHPAGVTQPAVTTANDPAGTTGRLPRWLRPIPIASAAAVVLLAILIPLVIGLSSAGPQPAAGATHPSAGNAKTGAATSRPATVRVVKAHFLGLRWATARHRLLALGLDPRRRTAPGKPGSVGRVVSMSASGVVRRGSTVVVTVGRHSPKPAGPTATTPVATGPAAKPHPVHPKHPQHPGTRGGPPGHDH